MAENFTAHLVRRLHTLNHHHRAKIEIVSASLDANGAGAIELKHQGKIRSIRIPAVRGKSLISGRRNPTLDNMLRL